MNREDKRQLSWIFAISIINGLLNVIGVASILPFISVISEPELIQTNEYIVMFSELTGVVSHAGIIVVFGLLSFVIIVIGNIISVSDAWISTRFSYIKEKQLSKQLFINYLNMDVLTFRRRKNAEKVKNILTEIDRVIISSFFAILEMIEGIIIASLVFALLLVIDPIAAMVIMSFLLVSYLGIYFFNSKHLTRLGQDFSDIETELYDEVMAPLDTHLEIKLVQKADYFIRQYAETFNKLIKNRLKFEFISLIPQTLLEIVAFGSIIFLAIYFSLSDSQGLPAVTLISVYAFAAYRMMPEISNIFDSYEQIQFSSAVLKRLVKQFTLSNSELCLEANRSNDDIKRDGLAIVERLELKNIQFRYHKSNTALFNKLSVSFFTGQFHCIKGKTGSGKSTLLNIIAGVYKIDGGKIHIDSRVVRLFENADWLSNLSYVPSRVNLIKSSVLENIALGVELEKIDTEKVIKCCKLVELDEHIHSLTLDYNSMLGGENLSFSSGQIQKVGIARALYREPKLLLLDESTDALDLATEQLVLENIKSIKEMTIIFVSHRPSVEKFSDHVIDLNDLIKRSSNDAYV